MMHGLAENRRRTKCGRRALAPRVRAGAPAAASMILLSACTGSLNQSDQLLDAPPLPALSAPTTPTLPPAAGQPSLNASNGLDRREWALVQVSSPPGQVEAQPTYVTTLFPDRSTARSRGEFPTGATVLQTDGAWDAQAWEAAANAAGSPLFIVSAPVEMLMGRWWWVTERDTPDYVRVPTGRGGDPWAWIEPPGRSPAAAPGPAQPPPDAATTATPTS